MFEITREQLKKIVDDFLIDRYDDNASDMEYALARQGIKVKEEFKLKRNCYYKNREGKVHFILPVKRGEIHSYISLHIEGDYVRLDSFKENGSCQSHGEQPSSDDLIEEVEDQHWFDKE